VVIRSLPKIPWREFESPLSGDRKTACVVRYGGFGDMIMAASLFPILKELGYQVVVNTTERGADLLKSDPHIDLILKQNTDQVPNHELTEYWAMMAGWFDKFINLSESVEGRLLPMKGNVLPPSREPLFPKCSLGLLPNAFEVLKR